MTRAERRRLARQKPESDAIYVPYAEEREEKDRRRENRKKTRISQSIVEKLIRSGKYKIENGGLVDTETGEPLTFKPEKETEEEKE